ncbi:MAG: LysM peptidoglycan-binding domain-containing protein [Roseovarius sp.]|nr:LysM peptidoglycan-binding domain-containing protein [Roseovarius sp.]
MSKFAGFGAGPVIGAGAAAVATAVAVGVYISTGDLSTSVRAPQTPVQELVAPEAPVPEAPVEAVPEPVADPAPAEDAPKPPARTGDPAPAPDAVAPPERDTVTAAPEVQSPPPPDPPALDTFRLDADGQILVAGRAVPGGRVAITVDDARIGTAEADGSGKFVAFLDLPPSDAARVLGLELLLEDGNVIRAADEILIAPAPRPTPQPEAVAKAVTSEPEPIPGPVAETGTKTTSITPGSETGGGAATETDGQPVPEPEAVAETGTETATPPTPEPATEEDKPDDVAETKTGTETATPPAPEPATEEDKPGQVAESADTRGGTAQEAAEETPDAAPELAAAEPAASEPPAPPAGSPIGATGGPVSQAPPADAPVAPTVMLSEPEGVRVLQAPAERVPEVMSSVALDAISYSDAGEVQLSGRASAPDASVRIYLDNRAVTTAPVDETGAWRSALPEVDTGIYTLRVDEVDAAGKVTSRVETPFKREDVETLAAQDEDDTPAPPRMSVVTVQPGSTLWAISREAYGEGILYVRVFEANRERIRDPDLIYPGQVFELPE